MPVKTAPKIKTSTEAMTINELIEKAHGQAKEKGFWDQERNTGELLMLIVSECGEALEAHRKGKRADMKLFDIESEKGPLSVTNHNGFAYEVAIKGSLEEELADIVIRIADLCGAYPKLLEWLDGKYLNAEAYDGPAESFNVGEQLLQVVYSVTGCGIMDRSSDAYKVAENLESAMLEVFQIADYMNIDLWRHISLKLAYNATRPRLHGQNY